MLHDKLKGGSAIAIVISIAIAIAIAVATAISIAVPIVMAIAIAIASWDHGPCGPVQFFGKIGNCLKIL